MTETDLEPEEVLMHLIVTLLTPTFLATAGVDLALARAAAAHTVSTYTARNPIDLILIAQAIALGLAVLSSVSLSMADDLSVNLIVRLRGNAASLNRAADLCRKALAEPQPEIVSSPAPRQAIDQQAEAAIVAEVAHTRAKAAAWQASLTGRSIPATSAQPQPKLPEPPATMKAAMAAIEAESRRRIEQADTALKSTGAAIPANPTTHDEHHRSAWCSAMADVAAEISADMATLPPAERRTASIRLAALNTTANTLFSGVDPYPPR